MNNAIVTLVAEGFINVYMNILGVQRRIKKCRHGADGKGLCRDVIVSLCKHFKHS